MAGREEEEVDGFFSRMNIPNKKRIAIVFALALTLLVVSPFAYGGGTSLVCRPPENALDFIRDRNQRAGRPAIVVGCAFEKGGL